MGRERITPFVRHLLIVKRIQNCFKSSGSRRIRRCLTKVVILSRPQFSRERITPFVEIIMNGFWQSKMLLSIDKTSNQRAKRLL